MIFKLPWFEEKKGDYAYFIIKVKDDHLQKRGSCRALSTMPPSYCLLQSSLSVVIEFFFQHDFLILKNRVYTPSTYMRSKIQVVSENVVEDYWEQVKARHIHNYVAYNNTRSATNSSTNSTKLTSRQSRRPRHPVISPFRMPPRG